MMEKFLIIASIILSTIGLSSQSLNIDSSLIKESANPSNLVSASEALPLPEISTRPKVSKDSPKPLIYTKNYILADVDSGTILAEKNSNDQVPIASTTKIMTAILTIENYNLDDIVTVSKNAAGQIDSGMYAGERMTVLNLLKCMMIVSANGAAVALAEHANGPSETGVTKFLEMMNTKAKELGMMHTDYHDPAGLDVTGYSTAFDLTLATKYAMKKPLFNQIVATKTETVTDISGKYVHDLTNSNRLVTPWDYPGILGVKTGYMPEAGHCLVTAVRRDGHTLLGVVLNTNANTPTSSADESKKLQDWGWQNTVWE